MIYGSSTSGGDNLGARKTPNVFATFGFLLPSQLAFVARQWHPPRHQPRCNTRRIEADDAGEQNLRISIA